MCLSARIELKTVQGVSVVIVSAETRAQPGAPRLTRPMRRASGRGAGEQDSPSSRIVIAVDIDRNRCVLDSLVGAGASTDEEGARRRMVEEMFPERADG